MSKIRGYVPWRPTDENRHWLQCVMAVLVENREELPLMAREIFYGLCSDYGYPKSEPAWNRLLGILSRGRRAYEYDGDGIPFDWIYDGGQSHVVEPDTFRDEPGFKERVLAAIHAFRLNRQDGQAQVLELWCEASGWLPLLEEFGGRYSARVTASSGYDSTPLRHELAQRVLTRMEENLSTVVLHIDFDPSGEDMKNVLQEDVEAMVDSKLKGTGDLPEDWFRLHRVALTAEQVLELGIPTAPPKPTDSRMLKFLDRHWRLVDELGTTEITAQLEALKRPQMRGLITDAIEGELDMAVYAAAVADEERQRGRLLAWHASSS